ncbi:MAG: diacylglycerol kinase family lipid kinase [Bacteroidetes bacterium]|nr:diacylglycerol kinase family lipid kinase [Bacteroidota bacterium]
METQLLNILFIVNPISGTGKQKNIQSKVNQLLNKDKFKVEFRFTERAGHAEEIARNSAMEGVDIVAVVGGDGSVNEVAKGLMNSKIAMAIIPTGSGNGLARHLKIPCNVDKALLLLNDSKVICIDTCAIAGHFFVGAAGLGFDALIAHEFAGLKRRGFASYIKVFLKNYFRYSPKTFSLKLNNQYTDFQCFVFSFLNSSQYGNGTVISPNSIVDDGQFEVVCIKKIPFFLLPVYAYKLFAGTLKNDKYFNSFSVKNILVKAEGAIAHIDGEPVLLPNEFEVVIHPKSLHVVIASKH